MIPSNTTHSEIFTCIKTGHKSPLFQFVVKGVSRSCLTNCF